VCNARELRLLAAAVFVIAVMVNVHQAWLGSTGDNAECPRSGSESILLDNGHTLWYGAELKVAPGSIDLVIDIQAVAVILFFERIVGNARAGGWDPGFGRVSVYYNDVGYRADRLGVRVPVWGERVLNP
jgi:hypothetical protein